MLTETGPEIHREAGGPEVGAIKGTTAKIGHLVEETGKAQTKEDGEAGAQTATGTREKGAAGAQTPEGAEVTARPETDGVPEGQTVQEVKKGRDPDPAPAPALTVTEILKFAFRCSSCSSFSHSSPELWLKRRLNFSGRPGWKCFLSALL